MATSIDRRYGVNGSLAFKAPVRAATTANITLSGLQTIDGIALAANDRVLVKDQTTTTENGIYDASTSAWTRSVDFNGNRDIVTGTAVYVTSGSTQSGVFYSVTTANPITIGSSSISFAVSVAAGSLAAQLASSSNVSLGPALVGFDWDLNYAVDTVGWGLMTARYSILKYIPVAQWAAIFAGTTTYDATTNITTALAAESLLTLPPGKIRGEWGMAGLTGKSIIGAGRETTTLENVDNTAVFTFDNTSAACQVHRIAHLKIVNRDEATYTTADAILFTGAGANQQEFFSFENVQCQNFRYGVSVAARLIWTSFKDCHFFSCVDGFHLDTTHNVSQLAFINCRFGTNTGYGLYATKASSDALSGWSFDGCTFEVNGLTGVRVSGAASGLAGWSFRGCYMEENATSVSVGGTNPRKANIFIDASLCLGLEVNACALYGSAGTAIDRNIYITSATTNALIGANRVGTATDGFLYADAGQVYVGPRDGGTTGIAGAGAYELVGDSSSTFTATLTGCTTSPTGSVTYVLQKNVVTLTIPTITATSNTTAATLTGIPAALRPPGNRDVVLRTIDDTAGTKIVRGIVDSSGVLTLFTDGASGAFAAAGTKGVVTSTVVYTIV